MAGKHANPPIVEDTTSQIKKVLNSLLKNRIVIPKPDEVRQLLTTKVVSLQFQE